MKDILNEKIPDFITVGYGTLYLHTARGQSIIQSLSEWKHIKKYHNISIGMFISSMIGAMFSLVFLVISSLLSPPEPTAAQDPVNLDWLCKHNPD